MSKQNARERFDHLTALGFGVYRVHKLEGKNVFVLRRPDTSAIRIIRTGDESLVARAIGKVRRTD